MSRRLSTELRRLPSVEILLQRPRLRALEKEFGRPRLVATLREVLEQTREQLRGGDVEGLPEDAGGSIEANVVGRLESSHMRSLRSVLNATGVVVHTNLGRAPLSPAAVEAVARAASGYSNLELDLETGKRGSRHRHASILEELFPQHRALVVNNAAAAVMLSLNTFAIGKEVIISRGELVEIGGSFRVPEILERSGAVLREVGTTNKTRLDDYREAIGPRTGALLRVHPSNFRIIGFTERATTQEIVQLGKEKGLPVIEDFGSGNLLALDDFGLRDEPTVAQSLSSGVDLCIFSGDKLLGGPQAGVLVGAGVRIDACRKNPMTRALRVDKMTYAALEVTLSSFSRDRAFEEIPVLSMIAATQEHLRCRAEEVVEALSHVGALSLRVASGTSRVGGGAAPEAELPTALVVVEIEGSSAERTLAGLRQSEPSVIARIVDDRVVLDLRTILPRQQDTLVRVLKQLAAK